VGRGFCCRYFVGRRKCVGLVWFGLEIASIPHCVVGQIKSCFVLFAFAVDGSTRSHED